MSKQEDEFQRTQSELTRARQTIRNLTDELKRLKLAGPGMALADVCNLLFKNPKIEWGFVQQQEDERHDKFRPTPGSSGSSIDYKDGRSTTWRVFVSLTDGGHCERSLRSLQATVEEVWGELGLELPKEIKWT